MNETQTENGLPGTTNWQITKAALNREIEGYASLTSVNQGGSISFFVSTAESSYTLDIFRIGWYGGMGGRSMMSTVTRAGAIQGTPSPDPVTGKIECNWVNPYLLTIPNTWVSGVYLVKLTASTSGNQSYIMFVVRQDSRNSALLFQSSVTTFEAYNNWPGPNAGGKSLYDFNSSGGAARKVSFNRPYFIDTNLNYQTHVGAGYFLRWEINMVRWLEMSGYDVSYCTNIDVHESPGSLMTHRAFLSVGHDEYWSWEMRTNVEAARDRGIGIGFFSANTCYWQIRLEPSSVNGSADRTIVGYKEVAGTQDPTTNVCLLTTLWRSNSCKPSEQALIGVEYIESPVGCPQTGSCLDMVIYDASHWALAGSGLSNGSHVFGLLGYEVDGMLQNNSPAGTALIAHSPIPVLNSDAAAHPFSDMTSYTASSGATVFATGTIQWSWGLDDYTAPAQRPSMVSPAVQQITRNVLARLTSTIVTQPGPPVSDDFHSASLNTSLWTFVNPLNDGSVSVNGTDATITVPGGTSHDVWSSGNFAPRIMQSIANVDFEVEVKFDSRVTTFSQMQGIIVEQDSSNYLRFDVYHDGASPHLFSASFVNNNPTINANTPIAAGMPLWLKLKRTGSAWTGSWSNDGTSYTTGVTFNQTLNVTRAGPFAANCCSPAPAFTLLIDHFFNTASPIVPEDGGPPGITLGTVTTTSTGATVPWTTSRPTTSQISYGTTTAYGSNTVLDNTLVSAHSQSISGLICNTLYHYKVTSANVGGGNSASSVDATFTTGACSVGPPMITGVAANPTTSGATVTWATDRATTSQVSYGTTTAYGSNTPLDSTLVTSHSVVLSGLSCNTGYHYKVTSADPGGANSASSGDFTFTTMACSGSGAPVSDDFRSTSLNTSLWTFVNPLNDGSVSVNGTDASITVPGGTSHDVWSSGNFAPRIMQSISNVDFEVEVKFDSRVTAFSQMQGIIVEQNSSNYLRFDVYHDGASPRLFSASFVNNSPTINVNTPIAAGMPLWLKLKRTGNTWTGSWSNDGTSYTTGGTFNQTLNVTKVGPFAANCCSSAPAFTAQIDHFFNTASPIVPEDGGPPGITLGAVTTTSTGATVPWTTTRPTTSQISYGTTAAYGSATVLDNTLVSAHSQSISGLVCNTLYHYKVTSANVGGGNSASSADATFTTGACGGGGGGPVSDNFNATSLNTSLWTFVNPLNDGSVSLNGNEARLTVPAGASHDVWSSGDFAPRIMQSISNVDFEVDVKFDSTVTTFSQMQGIIVEQDSSNYLRFDVYHDGASPRLFSASFINNNPTINVNTAIAAGTPLWLKLKRTGNSWTGSWSNNGTNYTTGVTFNQTLNVARIGPFVANCCSPAPGFTAAVDYFFNTASPLPN